MRFDYHSFVSATELAVIGVQLALSGLERSTGRGWRYAKMILPPLSKKTKRSNPDSANCYAMYHDHDIVGPCRLSIHYVVTIQYGIPTDRGWSRWERQDVRGWSTIAT